MYPTEDYCLDYIKSFQKPKSKKKQQFKGTKDTSRHLTKEYIYTGDKHLERCSASSAIIREMETQNHDGILLYPSQSGNSVMVGSHYSPIRVEKVKSRTTGAGKDAEKLDCSRIPGRNINSTTTLENSLRVSC